MAGDEHNQDELFTQYWHALAEDPAAAPPPTMSAAMARQLRQLTPPDPSGDFVAALERKLLTTAAPTAQAGAEEAPLLRAGLPIRKVRRVQQRFAPMFAMAAMLLVLVVGAALLAGMLAGRQQALTTGTGPTQGSAAVLTDGEQIAQRSAKVFISDTVKYFAASVLMTVSISPQTLVRQSDLFYQSAILWRQDSRDSITTVGQSASQQLTSTYIRSGTNTWNSDDQNAFHYPPNAPDMLQYYDGVSLLCGDYFRHQLAGSGAVAGRPAYIVDVVHYSCPTSINPAQPASSYSRVWIDEQTFVVLKRVDYDPDKGSVIPEMEVTNIQFNTNLDASLFAIPTATPIPPLTIAQARQQAGFPLFVPTNLPAGLTANPPIIDQVIAGSPRIHIYYHTSAGQLAFDVTDSLLGNVNLATPTANSDGTSRLADGTAAYFYLTPYQNCGYSNGTDNGLYGTYPNGRLSLVWVRNGTRISIGGPALGSSGFSVSKDQLLQIAAHMSSTADIGPTAPAPTQPVMPTPQPTDPSCPAMLPQAEPTGGPDLPIPAPTYSPPPDQQ